MQHHMIGTWTLEIKSTRRFGPDYATASFHADGMLTITVSGYTAHGIWVAVDPRVARVKALAPLGPAEGQAGWHTLEMSVSATGDDTISVDGTYSRPTPGGAPSVTTITGSGERLMIDPDS